MIPGNPKVMFLTRVAVSVSVKLPLTVDAETDAQFFSRGVVSHITPRTRLF